MPFDMKEKESFFLQSLWDVRADVILIFISKNLSIIVFISSVLMKTIMLSQKSKNKEKLSEG